MPRALLGMDANSSNCEVSSPSSLSSCSSSSSASGSTGSNVSECGHASELEDAVPATVTSDVAEDCSQAGPGADQAADDDAVSNDDAESIDADEAAYAPEYSEARLANAARRQAGSGGGECWSGLLAETSGPES